MHYRHPASLSSASRHSSSHFRVFNWHCKCRQSSHGSKVRFKHPPWPRARVTPALVPHLSMHFLFPLPAPNAYAAEGQKMVRLLHIPQWARPPASRSSFFLPILPTLSLSVLSSTEILLFFHPRLSHSLVKGGRLAWVISFTSFLMVFVNSTLFYFMGEGVASEKGRYKRNGFSASIWSNTPPPSKDSPYKCDGLFDVVNLKPNKHPERNFHSIMAFLWE